MGALLSWEYCLWSLPEASGRLSVPVTALTHMLDYALFPNVFGCSMSTAPLGGRRYIGGSNLYRRVGEPKRGVVGASCCWRMLTPYQPRGWQTATGGLRSPLGSWRSVDTLAMSPKVLFCWPCIVGMALFSGEIGVCAGAYLLAGRSLLWRGWMRPIRKLAPYMVPGISAGAYTVGGVCMGPACTRTPFKNRWPIWEHCLASLAPS